MRVLSAMHLGVCSSLLRLQERRFHRRVLASRDNAHPRLLALFGDYFYASQGRPVDAQRLWNASARAAAGLPLALRPTAYDGVKDGRVRVDAHTFPLLGPLVGIERDGDEEEMYSSVECRGDGNYVEHCLYRNVCVHSKLRGEGRKKTFHLRPGEPAPDINYTSYFDGRKSRFDVDFKRTPLPPRLTYVSGRTLWLHDYYPHHLGHFAELAVKLPADRKLFPGTIQQLVWHVEATEFNMQILRLAFENESYQVPLVFNGNWADETMPYCLEELMYVRFTTEYFRGFEEADEWRSLGLRRCAISTDDWPQGDETRQTRQRLRVLFYQRTFKKRILNIHQLEHLAQVLGFETVIAAEDPLNELCTGARVVQGVQIIVVSHGTSQFFTAFAPRFTVVVSILPPNFLQGGWKLFQFYASLRSVEFFTRYKRYGRFIQQSHAGKEPFQRRFHDKALLPCLFHADCTFYWENNYDVRVHPGDRPFSAD